MQRPYGKAGLGVLFSGFDVEMSSLPSMWTLVFPIPIGDHPHCFLLVQWNTKPPTVG